VRNAYSAYGKCFVHGWLIKPLLDHLGVSQFPFFRENIGGSPE